MSDPKNPIMAVIVGEAANFIAYSFAPAIVVTPMGALSVVIRFEFAYRIVIIAPASFNLLLGSTLGTI